MENDRKEMNISDNHIVFQMCLKKKQYLTEMAVHAENGRIRFKTPSINYLRTYQCPVCKRFHITHHSSREIHIRKLNLLMQP